MKKTTLMSVALGVALSTFALANETSNSKSDRGFSGKSHKDFMMKKRGTSPMSVFRTLDLSDEQKTAMRAIEETRISQMTSWEDKRNKEIEDMKKAFTGNTFDAQIYVQGKIEALTQRANDHAQDLKQMLNILTKEQKEQFFKKIQDIK